MSVDKAHCHKMAFDDKPAALEEIRLQQSARTHFKRRNVVKKSNLKLGCYECKCCDKWHLTTLKRKRKY